MQLFYSSGSPFVRKVMVALLMRGLEERVDLLSTNPHESPAALLQQNPLSKVPCLVTVEGLPLFDSRVICEYLDGLGTASPLFPDSGSERTGALLLQALGDGVMDAAVARRMQQPYPQDEGRRHLGGRNAAAIGRALDWLDRNPPERLRDIGAVSVACALGYLDFRFADEDWREGRPALTAWFAEAEAHPAMVATRPA
ncbi:glutathione S-transferase N-terminal domain-containing protein [Roseomonas haemaphysalidis]|jgi:glutathione S-transferase|uniref:Glutathione S-transferase N-terminal domain-containing protein n=1 Tax=Roseomonas haemaphysalidis TaxID=2768162 RepID=A0ABS3KN95_9PROT|nr:glutathione S-transferase N-terminal domain-containing protein [Roseomonas haemaphysalidis]MBO1078926.1 glutathione S-transferase N-terminal domain-containing protein [Roseomonas haemaphysalidis]